MFNFNEIKFINVISDKENIESLLFDNIYKDNIILSNNVDNNKINIIIGYNKSKELYSDSINILKNKIDDNVYWCFSLEENPQYFYKGIKYITDNIEDILKSFIKINILSIHDDEYKTDGIIDYNKYINKIKNINYELVYINKNVIYIYSKLTIYTIDLNFFIYFELKDILLNIKKLFIEYKDIIYNDLDNSYLANLINYYNKISFIPFISYFTYLYKIT